MVLSCSSFFSSNLWVLCHKPGLLHFGSNTISFKQYLMVRGAFRVCFILKSTTNSFIFSMFRKTLLHCPTWQGSWLCDVRCHCWKDLPFESSANKTRTVELCDAVRYQQGEEEGTLHRYLRSPCACKDETGIFFCWHSLIAVDNLRSQ